MSGYLLHDEATLSQIARDAVCRARRSGFDQAVCVAREFAGLTIKVKNGVPETAVRDGGQSVSVTVFDGGRTGTATTSTLTTQAVQTAVERAIAIARQVESDAAAGCADSEWLARDGRDVELYAPSGLPAADIAAAAKAIEDAAIDASATQPARVMEAGAVSQDSRWARAIGADFCRAASASSQSRWCVAIAERDGAMNRAAWRSAERRTDRLAPPQAIGATAVALAARKLGARAVKTQAAPVLLDATIAGSLVREFCGGLFGAPQHQKSTFLADAIGQRVLASHLDLVEDPFEPFGMASGGCDSEGVAGMHRFVVREGVVEDYFLSSRWARKLGRRSTGNADGTWNLFLTSRTTTNGDDLAGMLRRLGRGLWVTEFLGGRCDPVTGTYSKAVAGFWVEDGEAAFPVQDVTIAGELATMLDHIRFVGADVYRDGAVRTGSILLGDMKIAGR
ncbi:MAG: metallopeptidase TldD-related protein [Rhizomicrobium sp.]